MQSSNSNEVAICRACVAECQEYKSLYKEGIILGEVTTLASLLSFCTNVDFDENEPGALPRVVCSRCVQDIAKSYIFKKKVLESDEALRSQLSPEDLEMEKEVQPSDVNMQKQNANEPKAQKPCQKGKIETDLEELAAAAQMKREIEQHLYETQDEYVQLTVLQNEDEEQLEEDEEQTEEHQMEDDDDLEYVVQEVAENTEIYNTTDIEDENSAEQEVELEAVEMEHIGDDGDVEYEIHVAEIGNEYSPILTDDSSDAKRSFGGNNATNIKPQGREVSKRNRSSNKGPNPNFQCQVCHKQLSNGGSFKYHMQLHSDETPYKCNECGERFKTRNAYDGHIRTHDPNNPNTCKLCGKSYRQPSSLRTHMLSHTGEKPFKCNICGKSLTQKSGYKKHMLTHTGEKPHTCDICGKAFRISSNMLAHRRSHAGEKPYMCVECEKAFGTAEQLKRHMMVHSEEKPFICNICHKHFKRQSALRSHQQSHDAEGGRYDKKVCKSNVVEVI